MEIIEVFVNFIHMSSTTAWIGAILFVAIITGPIFKNKDVNISRNILESIFKRFRTLSVVSIVLMVISGIIITGREGAANVSLYSLYGKLFLVKHILMIIIAASIFISKFYLFPKINSLCKSSGSKSLLCNYQKSMLIVLYLSSTLGFGVLLITAFMQII